MKLQYYFSSFSFFFCFVGLQAQVPYVPMVEMFTNASCKACAQQQQHYLDVLGPYQGKVVEMEYHYAPDNEMDILAVQENILPTRRKNFYLQKIKEIPAMVIDGEKWPGRFGSPKDLTSDMISESLTKTALLSLDVTHTINENKDSVFIDVLLANDSGERFEGKDVFIYIALIEKIIKFDAPIGNNGQQQFRNVVRKMLPSYNGKKIGRNILNGRTLGFRFESNIPDYFYDIDQLAIVAWLQHTKDKVIYQCGESAPIGSTATKNYISSSTVQISPNPVIDFMNIELDFPNPTKTNIALLDINGHRIAQIREGILQNEIIRFSITHLKAGTYFLSCKTASNTIVKKVFLVK